MFSNYFNKNFRQTLIHHLDIFLINRIAIDPKL